MKHVFLSSKFCVCARIVLNVMREIAERYVQRQQRYVLEFRVHYFGTCESFAEETQESSHLKKQGRRATRQVPFPPEGTPATQSAGFPPVPPRPTERARGPFYPLFRSNPPQRGGGQENHQTHKGGLLCGRRWLGQVVLDAPAVLGKEGGVGRGRLGVHVKGHDTTGNNMALVTEEHP